MTTSFETGAASVRTRVEADARAGNIAIAKTMKPSCSELLPGWVLEQVLLASQQCDLTNTTHGLTMTRHESIVLVMMSASR